MILFVFVLSIVVKVLNRKCA